jgi:hypothetical protein
MGWKRKIRDQEPLAKTTFYRHVNQKILSMYCSETDNWFRAKNIPIPENYSLEKNRESLQTIFTFSDLKTYGGADIDAKTFSSGNLFINWDDQRNRSMNRLLSPKR